MTGRSSAPAAALLAAALLFTAPLAARQADSRPGPAAAPDSTPLELARRLPVLLESAEIPGLSAAQVADGRVAWAGAFGVRSAATGAPVDQATVFQAASLSKPVFAYLVMRLVDRGVLELDRPLAEYRPHPRLAHEPRYREITARMVLSHRTGMPNWGGDRLELAFDPGTGFGYSGEGYVYLQRVVEELTGLGLEALARREVFGPLGMERSAYVWQPRFEANATVGHDEAGNAGELARHEEANAAASLLTTARDFGRFVAAVLAGTGLSAEAHRTMLAPAGRAEVDHASAEENARIRWALGWGVQTGEPRSLWHWGDNGSHKAFVIAFPESGTAVVYFANSTHGLAIAEEVVGLAGGGHHWGPAWAGYEPHDDPGRLARRELLRVFREEGREAGLGRWSRLLAEAPEQADAELATGLARLLHLAERDGAAVAVLEEATGAFPDAPSVREELAAAYQTAGRFADAWRVLEELAAGTDGEAAERYRRQAAWVERRIAVEREPVTVPEGRLRAYAGDYGPRHVTYEDATLSYQREGSRRFRLVPLDARTFRLEGLETFRLRFVTGGGGRAVKVVGLYYDGRTDENERGAP